MIAAAGFAKSAINWVSDSTLQRYVNGSCTRFFCGNCGTPVAQEHESVPNRTYFNTAFMDEPERFPPTAHSYEGEQLPWLELSDDLPRAKKTISIEAE